jgi:hypothetical protein
MTVFWVTLLITIVCCLLMAAGVLLLGRPLAGGCGQKLPESLRCVGCPNRRRAGSAKCPNRGDH